MTRAQVPLQADSGACRVGSVGLPGGDVDAGIARKIDDLGRIVIPAETRRLFNIREGDQLSISIEGPNIVLRKLEDTCTFCGATDHVGVFKGRGICSTCRSQLS
jgi:transcriptional pleiotropic regulator of transition state genes